MFGSSAVRIEPTQSTPTASVSGWEMAYQHRVDAIARRNPSNDGRRAGEVASTEHASASLSPVGTPVVQIADTRWSEPSAIIAASRTAHMNIQPQQRLLTSLAMQRGSRSMVGRSSVRSTDLQRHERMEAIHDADTHLPDNPIPQIDDRDFLPPSRETHAESYAQAEAALRFAAAKARLAPVEATFTPKAARHKIGLTNGSRSIARDSRTATVRGLLALVSRAIIPKAVSEPAAAVASAVSHGDVVNAVRGLVALAQSARPSSPLATTRPRSGAQPSTYVRRDQGFGPLAGLAPSRTVLAA